MSGFSAKSLQWARRLVTFGPSLMTLAVLPIYALLVLQPLASENETMRVRVDSLTALSERAFDLEEKLAALQRELDEEAPSYYGMLQDLRGWRVEAQSYVSRIAADAGLEVTAMEWTETEAVTPEFEADQRRRWLRVGIFIRLIGAWRAHRNFARNLSSCDCLVQVLEKKLTASGHPGSVESTMSLFIYYPGDGANV